jgi:hypothetical protein
VTWRCCALTSPAPMQLSMRPSKQPS